MSVNDLLSDLAACLCVGIEESENPEPCFCGVIPGDAATGDYAGMCTDKCGMAYTRLMFMYPAVTPGVRDESVGNCGAGLGFDLEIGVMRCAPVGDSRGNPPTLAQYAAVTSMVLTDAMVMYRAILCCEALGSQKDWRLGDYTPIGPEGGLVGGSWSVSGVI